MAQQLRREFDTSISELQSLTALGGAAALVLIGLSQRSRRGFWFALAASPLVYRGVTGQWPGFLSRYLPSEESRVALSNNRGMHALESAQIEKPIEEVFRFWRRLENLPRFMAHLERVTELDDRRSHWIARGPGGVRVEWDAEIINEVENQVIGWESIPGSDVVTAGSVNFDPVRGGRGTRVTLHMRLEPPAGRAGHAIATLFGRRPSQDVREDLRRLRQLLDAGDVAQVAQPIAGAQ